MERKERGMKENEFIEKSYVFNWQMIFRVIVKPHQTNFDEECTHSNLVVDSHHNSFPEIVTTAIQIIYSQRLSGL